MGKLGKILESMKGLGEAVNPRADQIMKEAREQRDELSKENLPNLSQNLRKNLREAWAKDLNEIECTDAERAQALASFDEKWQELSMESQTAEILQSKELSAITGFCSQLDNLPVVQKAIEEVKKNPGKTKFDIFISGITEKLGLDINLKEFGIDFNFFKAQIAGVLPAGVLAYFGIKAPKKKAEGEEKEKNKAKAETAEAGKAPAESDESKETASAEPTLILGSMAKGQTPEAIRDKVGLSGTLGNLSKESQPVSGTLEDIKGKDADFWKKYKESVVLLGNADLKTDAKVDDIWSKMEEVYKVLKENGIKVRACLIPAEEGMNDTKRTELNEKIKNSNLVAEAIDLETTSQA